jgi:ubiquinone/menaquinone biosynthesis C-methylase UbiE
MKHPMRQYSARVNGGSKEVTINVTVDKPKPAGPVHLAGDERLPEGVAQVKTDQEIHLASMGHQDTFSFSNPNQNARNVGFKEGMKVADFGVGSGAYTVALADIVGPSGVVYAVDVQRELLTRVQNNAVQEGYENIEIVWGDIETIGGVRIRDGYLDGVVLSNTLFQVDDKISTIQEAWRVLQPGGILVVIDWLDSFGGLGPPQNSVVTQAETTVLCTDNGYAFKKDIDVGKHHYGLIFIKMVEGDTVEQVVARSHETEENFIEKTIAQELI